MDIVTEMTAKKGVLKLKKFLVMVQQYQLLDNILEN
jgi:hypothetical protein